MEEIILINQLKNDLKTYDHIRKIATGQGDDYTNGCLLDYPYIKGYYKLTAIDLSKKPKLDAILKQYNKVVLLEIYIEMEIHKFFSLLKNQKKQF